MINLDEYRLHHAKDLLPRVRHLPDRPAAYLILIQDGDRILETAGYFDVESRLPLQAEQFVHLYTGASTEWGTRVRRHLTGDCWTSTFRRSLLSMERQVLALSNAALGPMAVVDSEASLTLWLAEHALIGVKECFDPFATEMKVLKSESTPLNIDGRRRAPFSIRLRHYRNAEFPKIPRPPMSGIPTRL
jgi:hypothetical protein